ncbi:MAG: hypothetical protein P8Y14_23835 [Anaerolineales bacterium]|jgi:hypothetical protein
MLNFNKSTSPHLNLVVSVILGIILVLIVSLVLLMPAEAAPPHVGVATSGRNAFEFIGRIDQDDINFTGYGYLTYIRDLNNAEIYSDPVNPSESTARFTYMATATLTSRSVLTDVFVLDSQGTITFYFTQYPPSRSFDNPASFASGTPIATASMRYQDILLVQSANKGLATGVSEMTQLDASAFTLNGQSYQFGQPNLLYRLSTVGNGTRTNLDPLTSFVLLAGNAVTSGQQSFLPLINQDSNLTPRR